MDKMFYASILGVSCPASTRAEPLRRQSSSDAADKAERGNRPMSQATNHDVGRFRPPAISDWSRAEVVEKIETG
jgi:hypothetical protein